MSKVRPVITEKQYYGALRYAKKLAGTRGDHVTYFGDALNELLRLAELITDPLSQELLVRASDTSGLIDIKNLQRSKICGSSLESMGESNGKSEA